MVPTKASSSSARLALSRPRAKSASTLGSVSPASRPRRSACADLPAISLTTFPSLRLVSSSVFCRRVKGGVRFFSILGRPSPEPPQFLFLLLGFQPAIEHTHFHKVASTRPA